MRRPSSDSRFARSVYALDSAMTGAVVRVAGLSTARIRIRTRIMMILGFFSVFGFLANAPSASADPGCGDIPVVSTVCGVISGAGSAISFASDPLGYIAGALKDTVKSLMGFFATLVQKTTEVDFSNPGFLQTYAIAFGVACVFTTILWLLAVIKRTIAGVGFVEAIGESIGHLILSVTVTAFMPLAVGLVVQLVDDATNAALSPMMGNISKVGDSLMGAWDPVTGMNGGTALMILIGFLMMVAVAGVWLELVIRGAMIYATLAFGPLVFSGLVDKSLWKHTKRWIGVMSGVIASKYVTISVLALAVGLLANASAGKDVVGSLGIVLSALALFWLAMLAPMALGRMIPVIGDDLGAMYKHRQDAAGQITGGIPSNMSSSQEMQAKGGGGGGAGTAATAAADTVEESESNGTGGGGKDMMSSVGGEQGSQTSTGSGGVGSGGAAEQGASAGTAGSSQAAASMGGAEAAGTAAAGAATGGVAAAGVMVADAAASGADKLGTAATDRASTPADGGEGGSQPGSQGSGPDSSGGRPQMAPASSGSSGGPNSGVNGAASSGGSSGSDGLNGANGSSGASSSSGPQALPSQRQQPQMKPRPSADGNGGGSPDAPVSSST